MAIFKAIVFSLLVINLQIAQRLIEARAKVDAFLIKYLPGLREELVGLKGDIGIIVSKAKGALAEAVKQDQITVSQAKEVIGEIVEAAKEDELNVISEIDIALEEAVKNDIINTPTKVKILIAAIRDGLHKDPPATLEEAVEAAIDAAVGASIIDDETAVAILDVVPEEIIVDPSATADAEDVEEAVDDEYDPVGIKDEIREIAETTRAALKEAGKLSLITKDAAKDVIYKVWEAAKKNALTRFSEVDIALDAAVQRYIIDNVTKAKILLHAIEAGLYENLPDSLKETVAVIVDSAEDAGIINEETAAKLKKAAPKTVSANPDAVLSTADIEDVVESALPVSAPFVAAPVVPVPVAPVVAAPVAATPVVATPVVAAPVAAKPVAVKPAVADISDQVVSVHVTVRG